MKRAIGTMVLAAWSAAGLTACEPPPPPPVLEVNTTATGDDVNPGDGVCETAPDNGTCTLSAAVQEGDALGRAVVLVPLTDDALPLLSATITGQLTIRGTDTEIYPSLGPIDLTVAEGASLTLERFDHAEELSLVVRGTLVLRQSGWYAPDGIQVEPSGTVVVDNSLVWRISGDAPLFSNQGRVVAAYSAIAAFNGGGPLVVTAPGATTAMAATRLVTEVPATICAGELPVSLGHNTSSDDSCGLTATGDQPNSPPGEVLFHPVPGSPGLDAIPVGTLGCGDPGQTDVLGTPRPYDGDHDGVAACDIGAWEWNPDGP